MPNIILLLALLALFSSPPTSSMSDPQRGHGSQVDAATTRTQTTPNLQQLETSIRAEMEFLASDALQGRGSATEFERIAAQYAASQLRQFGVEPAGDTDAFGRKTYLQTATFTRRGRDANAPAEQGQTWNVIGVLRGGGGGDPVLSKQAILLSAHIDHLGTSNAARVNTANANTVNANTARGAASDDNIYNGADDDASGVVAVLELARALSASPTRKRTIYFVLFGSEEIGGYGATHFLNNPPLPLNFIVANLEFEMIGRPDAKVAPDTLWLTGFDRSNLGAELARRGARLVSDPHPEQNFFRRSDNYQLARRGVIAHTVSSFGLHQQYHEPDDDIAHVDFPHMARTINSMLKPIEWLANSDFTPVWVEGGRP